jgi:GntR family transcriptional regulator
VSERAYRNEVPAFVGAYDAIRTLIATRGLGPDDQLPGEVALAEELGTERDVLREALLLLQEDGYIVRNHTRHWVVAPPRGERVHFTDSFHRMLGAELVATRRVYAAVESTSTWSRELLQSDEECLVWETVFARDGVLLASTLEWLVVSRVPRELLEALDATTHDLLAQPTMLEAVGPEVRAELTPTLWRFVPVSRNAERLSWMELPLHGIPVALTVVLADDERPVYLAKNLFDLGTFNVSIDGCPPA